ncbi:SDR family NAD(P)-dependent oxidoreductase [Spirosoma sp. HMF4905]|uniref:SDR family NAD(P)-dependent oxidoreductase n=1 Tax=Spirosoma arboris TaxID=2682092 RepID=A0A7K1S7C1_9BACT|nr:SDR family NAD(P)-dependent oxidoreductase [Spirosoma arboris]MVM29743.1 SDR family NAD(P)-dependent oxidoreductase [Spirosoma arboris]
MELSNNTILITGGTSGFGYEFASQLLNLGNTVLITGRDQTRLDQTKKKLPNVHTFQSDVSNPEAIAQLFEKVTRQFPDLNILINNAGEMRKLNLLDPMLDPENVNREIAINLSGPVRMVQQFLPHLMAKKSAAILNVTSGIAFVPFPLSPIYGATKSGLRAYTQALRVQLKKTNIRVFELVAPGAKTPLNDKFEGDVDSGMMMEPDKLIAVAIKGMMKDKLEILPGIAVVLKYLSRIAPNFLFNQMSKVAEKSLAQSFQLAVL